MKKTILVIVIMSLLLSVCSCASSSSKEIESLNQKISELEKQGESTTAPVSTTSASVQSATTSQATTAETFVASPDLPYDYTTRPMSVVENFYFETLTADQVLFHLTFSL